MTEDQRDDRDDRDLVRRGYDELGDAYAEQRSPTQQELSVLAAFLDDRSPDARVLDAGCGRGTPVLERTAELQAVGLDISRSQLEGAAVAAPAADLVQGDLASLPFAADAFDAATALYSLIHVPRDDHQTVVAELARVLRPGGDLLLSEGEEPWSGTRDDWLGDGTAMTWDIAGLDATTDRLRDVGFEVVEQWGLRDELADEAATKPLVRARLTRNGQ